MRIVDNNLTNPVYYFSYHNKKGTDTIFKLTSCSHSSSYTSICFSAFIYLSNSWSFSTNPLLYFPSFMILLQYIYLNNCSYYYIYGWNKGNSWMWCQKNYRFINFKTTRHNNDQTRIQSPHLAFFHILTHALFKALLFICAGSFIGCHLHTQDLRWMGNITNQMPVATRCVTLANLALCGFPFIAGFYSKDIIIEAALNNPNNIIILLIAIFSLGLTSFYSIRFSLTTIWGPSLIAPWLNITEEKNIIIPILFLSFISITCGSIIFWFPPVSSSFYIVPSYLKFIPLIMVILGATSAYYLTVFLKSDNAFLIKWTLSHYSLCTIWFLVPLSSQFILKWPMLAAHWNLKYIDQGWLEFTSGLNTHRKLLRLRNQVILSTPKGPTIYLTSFIVVLALITLII